MVALAGPYFMFATLLVISGLPKLTNPVSTARALEAIGLPASRSLGRSVGVAEIIVGFGVMAVGGPIMAGALAVLYAGFAGFIVVALRSTKVRSCGCFGGDDTPPSRLHLGIDVAAAAIGTVLVFQPIGHIGTVMGETPWAGLPLLGLVVVGAWLSLLVLTLLPAVFAEAQA